MKIAVFVSLFPKLSETFVLNQIVGLIEAGHEVDIFPHDCGVDSAVQEDVISYGLLRKTYYKPEVPQNWLLRILKAMWLFVRYGHRNPTALLKSLNILKYSHWAASLLLYYQTIAVVRGNRNYDIIHCHFGQRGNFALVFKELGALRGVISTSFYGQDLTILGNSLKNYPYSKLFQEGNLFLPISNFFQEKLIKMGCPPEKIFINHIGVDINRFHYYERKRAVDEPLCLLSAGRLVEKKGLDTAIRAVVKARQQGCNCTYDIIGDGPQRDKLVATINNLNASNYITLRPPVTHKELQNIILDKHAYLLPSKTAVNGDMEGIPFALMEASASGLPVLSTSHSGIPELIEDGVSGFLVAEGDSEALAERIIQLAVNPQICHQMGKSGRRIVEGYFNLQHQNRFLINLFENIASGSQPENNFSNLDCYPV